MARPSKLTDKEWAEVERRLLNGEKPAALAKEYGIDRAALTRKFSQQLRNVKDVANQIVQTKEALRALPVAQQVQAIELADHDMQMRASIKSAGNDTALVSKMFAKAAKDATSQIMFKAMSDDGETISPERLAECVEEIAAVMKSTVVSNEASKIGLKLMDIASREVADKDDKDNMVITIEGGLPELPNA